MTIKWFTDQYAKQKHRELEAFLKPMAEQMFPNHLFTHSGFNRNENTDEITIKLHLRPIGEAMEINDRLDKSDYLKLL
jgi:hypothetical protein